MKTKTLCKFENLRPARSGVAAVEAALMLPLLVIVTFGAIDVAQYINLGQVVCNASREGARIASRIDCESVEEVETVIAEYLASSNPQLSAEELTSALNIRIRKLGEVTPDYDDTVIAGGKLDTVGSGNPISIEVEFDFSMIRWLSGLPLGDPSSTTHCRRE